jgi:hypothetical protein
MVTERSRAEATDGSGLAVQTDIIQLFLYHATYLALASRYLYIMESYILPNFPREFSSIHLCLFQNVTNSASLRTRLVQAATMEGEKGDEERDVMDFGFVEASMVRFRVFVRYDTEQEVYTGCQPGTYLDGNLPSFASRLK